MTSSPKLLCGANLLPGLVSLRTGQPLPTCTMLFFSFSFLFFSFADNSWCLLCLRDPRLRWGWHCSVCCMSQICSWMRSIIIRQRCKARRPWEEGGIVLQMGTSPPPRPGLLAIHPRWRGIILCFVNNRISCHWKGCFSATWRSSRCVSLSCGWHSNLAVISANIHHLSWQHGVHCLASCSHDWCVSGLLCMLISSQLRKHWPCLWPQHCEHYQDLAMLNLTANLLLCLQCAV